MIRTIYNDEYGRKFGEDVEVTDPDQRVHYPKHDDGGAEQTTTEWKGTQRRPASHHTPFPVTPSEATTQGVSECNGEWVLKKSLNGTAFHLPACAASFWSPFD
jgi:hypothetical protein